MFNDILQHTATPTLISLLDGIGGGTSPYLDGVLDSVCCDLDATIAASYGGSGQTWANLIASPADGASQTDYDCWFGESGSVETPTTDPTFTGTAGDVGAYMLLDTKQDHFKFKSPANMTAMTQSVRKVSGGSFWFGIVFRAQNDSTLGTDGLLGGATNTTAYRGAGMFHNSAGKLVFWSGHSSFNDYYETGAGVIVAGNTYVILMSCNPTLTTNNLRIWVNSTDVDYTANINMVTDTVGDANYFIGGGAGASNAFTLSAEAGTRYKWIGIGNEFLDDTKAASIIGHLETRHGVDYTP